MLSITAPTDGATVGVRQLAVAGTVIPGNAAVTIGGRPAPVRNGRFQVPLQLNQPTETITITGQARGYQSARTTTTVRFSSQTATTIHVAHKAATVNHTPTAHQALPAFLGQAFQWPGAIGDSTSSVGSSTPASGTSGTSGASGTSPGQSTGTSAPSPSASSPSSPAPNSSGGSPVAGGTASTPASAPTPAPWTPQRVRDVYLQLCTQGHGDVTAFCRCTYQRMARAGALRSRTSLVGLVRRLKRYAHTHKLTDLPRFMRNALFNCVQKLPGNDPSKPLPVEPLPGVKHPAQPAPSATTTSTTTTAPSPASP